MIRNFNTIFSPATGEETHLGLWIALAGAAVAIIAILLIVLLKKKKNDEE